MYRVADLKASIPKIDDEHHAQRVGQVRPSIWTEADLCQR
jgi:hypothetical protein